MFTLSALYEGFARGLVSLETRLFSVGNLPQLSPVFPSVQN
jgi:hypothetical protein